MSSANIPCVEVSQYPLKELPKMQGVTRLERQRNGIMVMMGPFPSISGQSSTSFFFTTTSEACVNGVTTAQG